jgi:hypothetical protein
MNWKLFMEALRCTRVERPDDDDDDDEAAN